MAAAKKEVAEEVVEKVVEEPKGEKMVTIKLPKSTENAGPVFVSVNERTFLIQRGVPVDVPASVAEVIATSERYEDEATEYELAAQRR
ncbi:MAG: hypothetical protein IKI03_10640 [Clostridia bacterium]|nr:hypothetical protein [Clostridia bacterium]